MKVRLGNGCLIILEPETMEEQAALWRCCEQYGKDMVIRPAEQSDGRVFAQIDLREGEQRR